MVGQPFFVCRTCTPLGTALDKRERKLPFIFKVISQNVSDFTIFSYDTNVEVAGSNPGRDTVFYALIYFFSLYFDCSHILIDQQSILFSSFEL